MRRAVGLFLVTSPFLAVGVLFVHVVGIVPLLAILAVTVAAVGLIGFGLHLLMPK